ncbi:MAG TPA: SGNH/GDSL hydrolase family protein [Ramlibacter sp.]|jgi:phospholipase/lecithinase/hemolysin|uniref:SGNH/GDSL hydrolase family protein n=1 Tax=Ramlibacter sp. TaxID=1917967 RepID=UPI002D3582AE|nr:SGNH/GDSL hydrolase family protein [Ramlibacter sp.]HZY20226.1 SGNH/GDSL hydrolase family protein [Ramlibacter sp.]
MDWKKSTTALAAASFAALAVLTACGGGGDAAGPKSSFSRVVVAGDSLADVGTFGAKATVQNSADPKGFPLFPEIVAQSYGLTGQCNFYRFTGSTFAPNSTPGCTNFAIGNGYIVNPASQGGAAGPQSIPLQLSQAATAAGGRWSASDLILVDGGGNDAKDLIGAYLGLSAGAPGLANYQAFLGQQLDSATLAATLPQTNGPALAAGLYMQKVADTYYEAIKTQALDKGATHVAVLNMPDVTLTPRFRAALAGVAAASGGGSTGAAAAATLQGAIRQWITAFNDRLRARVAGDARIALVDFYADLTDEVANFTAYGLTNATAASCPATGTDSSGLPTYSFPACTSAALDAAPPAGASAGWWQTWAFSDGFHPSPYGHRLLAATVSRALARAGWL